MSPTCLINPLRVRVAPFSFLPKVCVSSISECTGVRWIKWDILIRPHGMDKFGEKDSLCNTFCWAKFSFLRPWRRFIKAYFIQCTPEQSIRIRICLREEAWGDRDLCAFVGEGQMYSDACIHNMWGGRLSTFVAFGNSVSILISPVWASKYARRLREKKDL